MSKHQLKMIVFDWDGTLFDSTAVISKSIQSAVRDLGGAVPSSRDATRVIGLGLMQALEQAAPDIAESDRAALKQRYIYHYAQHQQQIHLFDGILDLLKELKLKQHRLAVATGKSRMGLNEALSSECLHGIFDDSRTADETQSKPHPLMLHELMEVHQIAAHEMLMIGDTTYDLEMAQRAGCPAIGVTYGAHEAGDLQSFNPLALLHSVAQLRQWLLAHA
jgi:phosphoglycolate phosphatase